MKDFLSRFKYKWLSYRNYNKEINRRVKVEAQLWDYYHGKKDLPNKEQCKEMALTLGVPDSYRIKQTD